MKQNKKKTVRERFVNVFILCLSVAQTLCSYCQYTCRAESQTNFQFKLIGFTLDFDDFNRLGIWLFSRFPMHVVEKLAHEIEPNSAIVLLIVKC